MTETNLVITNTLNSNRIEIQNKPEFSLKVFNIHNQEVMELQGDRLVMDNVSHFSQIPLATFKTTHVI